MRFAKFSRDNIAALLVVACAGTAAGAASDTHTNSVITAKMLLKMSPQEIAQLVGDNGKVWVAKTLYSDSPLGTGLSAIVLFSRPEPLAENICAVDLNHISLDAMQPEHDIANDTASYRASEKTIEHLFAIPAPANGASIPQHGALADRCQHTVIRPDYMARTGADNVFASTTPEMASAGAKAFDVAVATARDHQLPLSFALECSSPMEHVCEEPRNTLAKLTATDFESVSHCTEDDCIRVQGFDGRFDWSLDIYSDRKSEDPKSIRITRVKMVLVPEPVI